MFEDDVSFYNADSGCLSCDNNNVPSLKSCNVLKVVEYVSECLFSARV